MNNSFCQQFATTAEANSNKLAMKTIGVEGSEYTYGEMLDAIRSIAFRLENEGIQFGDRVALIAENHPRWAICYFGVLFRGAVCVPVDPHGEIETITNFFENSETKMAFIGEEFKQEFQKIEENLGRKVPAVVLQDNQTTNGFENFSDWAKTERPSDFDKQPLPAKPEDLALLMYTSGTTGKPKGVALTHGNIFYETNGCQEVMNISENEVVLSVLPLFHVFAQVVNLWVIASIGGTICYVEELTPGELEKAFKTGEITLLTGVPRIWYLFHKKVFDKVKNESKAVQTLFAQMLKTNYFLRKNFNVNLGKKFFSKVHDGFGGNLDVTISAGSRFDEKIAKDYYALGFSMIQGYGLTETSGAVTSTRFEDNVVGSVGKPVNYAEVKLGSQREDGAGEVLIKGKMVFGGYYKNEEATKEAFTEDGWFKSGDLGKFDENGHLFIVGRSKDVIVLPSGKNIHPEDLEVHYSKSPLVEEICVLGVKDESSDMAGAEKLVAAVVPDFEYLKANNIANSREAVRYDLEGLGRELPEYQRVRDYFVRAEPLPRTATRKIKRFEVAKEIAEGKFASSELKATKKWELNGESSKLIESNAGKAVVSAIKQNTKDVETIHPEMNLEIDLGLDSLSRAEVFASLENAFSIEFETDEAAQALTVGEVIKLTEKEAGETASAEIVPTDFNWGKIVREADENLPEIQGALEKRTFVTAFLVVVFKSFAFISKILFGLEIKGAEKLNKMKRPFLICPNHQSFLDPFLVSSASSYELLRNTFAVGATQFFNSSFMRFIAQILNVVPIDLDMQLLRSMKAGAVGLKHGKALLIFPEGERGFDGELLPFRKGAAILAAELDVPIMPVAIDGAYKVWGRKSKNISFSKIKIQFGEPFLPKEVIGKKSAVRKQNSEISESAVSNEEKYEAVTEHLKAEIEKMIEKMRN